MIDVGNIKVCTYGGGAKDLLCVEPRASRRQHPSWIMWIYPDGSAKLYTEREDSGAVIGEPILLAANRPRQKKIK